MGKERKAIEYIGRRKDKWWYQMNPTRTGRPGSFLLGEKANYEPSLFFCEMRRWVMNSSAYSRIQVSSSALWKGRRQRRRQQQQHGKRETRHHVWKRHSMKSAKLFLYGRWNERDGRGGNKNILYKYLLFFLLLLVRCVIHHRDGCAAESDRWKIGTCHPGWSHSNVTTTMIGLAACVCFSLF